MLDHVLDLGERSPPRSAWPRCVSVAVRLSAPHAGPDRHEDRLQRRRLRRVHACSSAGQPPTAAGWFIGPSIRASNSCSSSTARTSSPSKGLGGETDAERRAAGDDRVPRLAMRLLHARLRRRDDGPAGRARRAGRIEHALRADRQPVPLHRLHADHRSGPKVDAARHQRDRRAVSQRRRCCASLRSGAAQPIEVRAEWDDAAARVRVAARFGRRRWRFSAEHPDATIVAGATDIGVRINKSLDRAGDDSRPQPRGRAGRRGGRERRAGARRRGPVGRRSKTSAKQLVPEFHKIVAVFGAPQIRHVGTIGGNIANASPIADSLPFLFVMEAVLELRSADGTREREHQRFYKGYKKFDLRPGELIAACACRCRRTMSCCGCTKSRGGATWISPHSRPAIRMRLDGETIAEAAIAFGAVGPDRDSCAEDRSVSPRPHAGRGNDAASRRRRRSPRSRRSATSAARPTTATN